MVHGGIGPAYPGTMRLARFRLLILLAVTLVAAVACSTAGVGPPSPATQGPPSSVTQPSRLLDPDEFATAIADQRRVTVNVHVPFEGTLAGTDLMIPYDRIQQQVARLPADRKTPLAIYCRTGRMSAIAARSLAALGYPDVVELKGGMQAWQASGRPVSQTPPRGG